MQKMLQQFKAEIEEELAFLKSINTLIAISGGVDSVVMAQLFKACGIPFVLAHCNFKLRGEESDGDEQFIRNLAKELEVELHVKHFDTELYARQKRISIQMAARDLRYAWFNQLLEKCQCVNIATAHHADDSMETFLINLTRGAGIEGLTGMQQQTGNVVRPLLHFSKEQIKNYAITNEIQFREDSSNASDKYMRNKIRNEIMPLFRSLNPSFDATLLNNMQHLNAVKTFYLHAVEQWRAKAVQEVNDAIEIDVLCLNELADQGIDGELFIHGMLKPYGFNPTVCREIHQSILSGNPGKRFFSATHDAILDREKLFVRKQSEAIELPEVMINGNDQNIAFPIELAITAISGLNFTVPSESTIACLDQDRLKFPLRLRKWEEGDKFIPLGMKGQKKVSDYLVDAKVPLHQKETTFVLISGAEIVWLVGHRIANDYRITEQTSTIFRLEML
jgi:tRNA(Ile)-lysidine synthase